METGGTNICGVDASPQMASNNKFNSVHSQKRQLEFWLTWHLVYLKTLTYIHLALHDAFTVFMGIILLVERRTKVWKDFLNFLNAIFSKMWVL